MVFVLSAPSGIVPYLMYIIGIDIAKATFTTTGLVTPQELLFFGKTFDNDPQGFDSFFSFLLSHHLSAKNSVVVMESTGTYGDRLRYFLYQHTFSLYVEPAVFIRRAFRLKRKTDPIDSRMIAEYGYRYHDQLHAWQPQEPILEQIQAYLVSRELLVKERTAHKNMRKALLHKERQLQHSHDDIIIYLTEQIDTIEEALQALLQPHQSYRDHVVNLQTIPGCGFLYVVNFFVITDGFVNLRYKSLANYLGIVPHEYSSGSSINKKPKSDKQGPDRMRKILHLCAMAAIRNEHFNLYYRRKQQEGKVKIVVLNNVKNKILQISCALVRNKVPSSASHKPMNPTLS